MPPRTAFTNTARVSDIFYPITPNANMDQTIKSSEIDLAESTIEKHNDTVDMTTQAQLFGAGTSIFDSSKIEKKSRYAEEGQANEQCGTGSTGNENLSKHRQSFIEARKNMIDKIQFKDKNISQFHAFTQDGMKEMDISFGKARNSQQGGKDSSLMQNQEEISHIEIIPEVEGKMGKTAKLEYDAATIGYIGDQ